MASQEKLDSLASLLKEVLFDGQETMSAEFPFIIINSAMAGRGIIWKGLGANKQIIFTTSPDRFFISENIDLARGKQIAVNNIKLIDEKELGPTITKSNLKDVGRLNGLIVDGDLSIGDFLVFNNSTNRLGLGTNQPNATFSVVDNEVEVVIGNHSANAGLIGTYGNHNIDIVTNNTSRISVNAGGNIILGNPKLPPVQISVHGKLAIKVNSPDPEVDLHVAGAVKFGNRLQRVDRSYPTAGAFNAGDIVWNSEPRINQYVGWICVQAGTPGLWESFGKIGNS